MGVLLLVALTTRSDTSVASRMLPSCERYRWAQHWQEQARRSISIILMERERSVILLSLW